MIFNPVFYRKEKPVIKLSGTFGMSTSEMSSSEGYLSSGSALLGVIRFWDTEEG